MLRVALICAAFMALASCASHHAKKTAPPPCPKPKACPPQPVWRPVPPPVVAQEPQTKATRQITLMGFAADGKRFAVEVVDSLVGSTYQVFKATDDATPLTPAARTVFNPTDAKTEWARFRRKYRMTKKPLFSPAQPGTDYVLMAAQTADAVVVYVMKGKQIAPYLKIPRLKTKRGRAAKITIKRLAWEPSGGYAVFIHNQSLASKPPFSSDYIHTFRVWPYRVPF